MTAVILALVAALSAIAAPVTPPSLADYPRGESPRVGYVDHGTWRGPGGRTVDVPDRHVISAITPYDGGFFIADTRYFEGSVGLVRVDADGNRVVSWASSGRPTVADDGSVAWTSFTPLESGLMRPSLVHIGTPGGCVQTFPRAGHIPFSVAGFIGEQVVVNGASSEASVTLLGASGQGQALSHLLYAFDANDRWIAGDLGRGTGLVHAKTGEVLWRARGYGLVFGPSGRRIAMTHRDEVVVRRTTNGREL